MSRRTVGVLAAILIGAGCEGEQAMRARPPDGGGGMVTGSAGTSGTAGAAATAGTTGTAGRGGTTGSAGTAGTTATAGTTGAAGTSGAAGTGGAGGTTGAAGTGGAGGTTGAAGRGGTTGTAGTGGGAGRGGTTGAAGTGGTTGAAGTTGVAGTGVPSGAGGWTDAGSGPFNCPTVIRGILESGDPTQTGRESRIPPAGLCGSVKGYPGNAADPGNPHLYDVYRFANPSGVSACFTFTLNYDGATTGQRYLTAYTNYIPSDIGAGYLGDVGNIFMPSPAFCRPWESPSRPGQRSTWSSSRSMSRPAGSAPTS